MSDPLADPLADAAARKLLSSRFVECPCGSPTFELYAHPTDVELEHLTVTFDRECLFCKRVMPAARFRGTRYWGGGRYKYP